MKELHFGGFLTKKRPDDKQADMVYVIFVTFNCLT